MNLSAFRGSWWAALSAVPVLAFLFVGGGREWTPATHAAPKPPQGATPSANDCLNCHETIARALLRKHKHAALDAGCDSCHVDHRAPPGAADAKPEKIESYLTFKQPDLCLTCHDPKEQPMVAAHKGVPFAGAKCSRCHDPHASDAPKLALAFQHAPYEAAECDTCHAAAQEGKVKLTAAHANELCLGCHEEIKGKIDSAQSRHSVLATGPDSCLECHDPHATRASRMLVMPQQALCSSCHGDVTAEKKFIHEPVIKSCAFCHDPHASSFANNLQSASNNLCLGCHGPGAVKIVQGTDPVTLFDGRVTLPVKPFEDLKIVPLDPEGKIGHPIEGHPVLAPAKNAKPAINCLTCHLVHGANRSRALLVTEDPNPDALCIRCHK